MAAIVFQIGMELGFLALSIHSTVFGSTTQLGVGCRYDFPHVYSLHNRIPKVAVHHTSCPGGNPARCSWSGACFVVLLAGPEKELEEVLSDHWHA